MTAHPTAPVRVGIVGCGNVLGAYMALAERLQARGEIEVRVACGRPSQQARAASLGIPRFVTDDVAVTEAEDVDLVLVLTSPPAHGRLARAALAAGKHVLVEKPLATELDEARAVLAAARASRGRLLAAPFTPLSPTFRALLARVRRGEIGRIVSARARYGWSGPDWHDWFYRPGGGVLFDLTIYPVTTLAALLGPVRAVTAMTGTAVPERLVRGAPVAVAAEDNAQIVLEHEGGALSLVTSGYTMQQVRSPAVELYGTDGTLQMLGDDWDPEGHELYRRDVGAWQLWKETDPEWPWTDGLRHLVGSARAGRAPAMPPELALHAVEILVAARAAGAGGGRVPVTSTFPALALAEDDGAAEPVHRVHDRGRRLGEAGPEESP